MQCCILSVLLTLLCAAVPVAAQDSASNYFKRGYERAAKKNFTAAIEDFSIAITFNPEFKEAHYHRGIAFLDQGEFDAAIADFDKAIALDPKFVEAYVNRGFAKCNKAPHDHTQSRPENAPRISREKNQPLQRTSSPAYAYAWRRSS